MYEYGTEDRLLMLNVVQKPERSDLFIKLQLLQ